MRMEGIIFIIYICQLRYYVFNSYTMGTSGLPDIYTRSPRAEGVYISGESRVHMV